MMAIRAFCERWPKRNMLDPPAMLLSTWSGRCPRNRPAGQVGVVMPPMNCMALRIGKPASTSIEQVQQPRHRTHRRDVLSRPRPAPVARMYSIVCKALFPRGDGAMTYTGVNRTTSRQLRAEEHDEDDLRCAGLVLQAVNGRHPRLPHLRPIHPQDGNEEDQEVQKTSTTWCARSGEPLRTRS